MVVNQMQKFTIKFKLMKKVVILGIDNFNYKNIYQVENLNNYNYKVYVFTNDVLNNSSKNLNLKEWLKILASDFLKDISNKQFCDKIRRNTSCEIYPGSRFSFIYLIISIKFKLKSIIVERGDISL